MINTRRDCEGPSNARHFHSDFAPPHPQQQREPVGRYHLAGEFCPEESVKTVYMVAYERVLTAPNLRIGDANALLSCYDSIPVERRCCYVHGEGREPEPPEPIETDKPLPGETDNPFEPPEPSYDPFAPPTQVPGPIVTIEPPQPSMDPVLPPAGAYIPAVDEWGNPIP